EALRERYSTVSGALLERVSEAFAAAAGTRAIRLHGDCHLGNLLWNEHGPVFVDLDDCATGVRVQDLWMMLAGPPAEQQRQWGERPGIAGGAAKPAAAPRKAQPGDVLSPNMVSAVGGARIGPASVQVKFELRERPDVAQPLDIELVILPASSSLDRLYGRVEVADGLQLTEGAQIAPTDRPAQDAPIRHSIRVLPTRDGIFTVNAVVSVDSAGQSWSQTFSIPIIVGAGPALPV